MAEPARQFGQEPVPGNQDSPPLGKPRLKLVSSQITPESSSEDTTEQRRPRLHVVPTNSAEFHQQRQAPTRRLQALPTTSTSKDLSPPTGVDKISLAPSPEDEEGLAEAPVDETDDGSQSQVDDEESSPEQEDSQRLEPSQEDTYDTGGAEASRPGGQPDLGRPEVDQNEKAPEDSSGDGKPSDLKQKEEAGGEPAQDSSSSQTADNTPEESLYKKGKEEFKDGRFKRFLNSLSGRKKLFAGTGAAGLLIAALFAMFNFLNVFKMPHVMANFEQKAFQRYITATDRRSDKWIKAYVIARLGEYEDSSKPPGERDNHFFRAEKVDSNTALGYFVDWYKTMRTSSFEDRLWKNQGVKFTSGFDKYGRPQVAKITVKGNIEEIPKDLFDAIQKGNFKLSNIEASKYGIKIDLYTSGNDHWHALTAAIKTETHDWQIIKRRHIRKNMLNMLGGRSWRFFAGTRDKISEKKINIQNKIITKAVPGTSRVARLIQCILGAGTSLCAGTDPSDPKTRATPTEIASADICMETSECPDANDAKFLDKISNEFIKTSLGKALNVVGIIQLLDFFNNIHQTLSHHLLSKSVVLMRSIQAAGYYQVLATLADQMKSGNVNGPEVNQLGKEMGDPAKTEAWTKVIDNKGDDIKLINQDPHTDNRPSITNTDVAKKYCSGSSKLPPNETFHYSCTNTQISYAGKAAMIENVYNSTFGPLFGKIFSLYQAAKNTPIGKIFFGILYSIFDTLESFIVKVLNAFLKPLGIDIRSWMTKVVKWLVNSIAELPLWKQGQPYGVLFNIAMQGGSYTAEASGRAEGAALTTPESKKANQQAYADYLVEKNATESNFDKYLSLDNPDSLASKTAFGLSEISSNPFDFINKIHLGNIFGVFAAPFTAHAGAAANTNLYAASQFAGTPSFDFPQQCYDVSPLVEKPQNVTNVLQVLQKYGAHPDAIYNAIASNNDKIPGVWETMSTKEKWYDELYKWIGERNDADTIAEQVYNCALLDNVSRSGLGYLSGWSRDDGVQETTQ